MAGDHNDPFGYLADTIRGLLDELGIDKAHLIGNSHGGEGQAIFDKLAQFKTGAQSLLRREDSVKALAGAGIPDSRGDAQHATY